VCVCVCASFAEVGGHSWAECLRVRLLCRPAILCARTLATPALATAATGCAMTTPRNVTIVGMGGELLAVCQMKSHNKVSWLHDQVRESLKLGGNMELDLVTKDLKKLDDPYQYFRKCVTEEEWRDARCFPDGTCIQSILVNAVRYPSTDPHALASWEIEQRRLERRGLAAAMGIHTMASTTAAATSLTAASSSGGSG
jgi:hypothetical protein